MTLVRRYDCPARRSGRAAPCRGVFQRLTAHAAHPENINGAWLSDADAVHGVILVWHVCA